jgi:hypothetical protein
MEANPHTHHAGAWPWLDARRVRSQHNWWRTWRPAEAVAAHDRASFAACVGLVDRDHGRCASVRLLRGPLRPATAIRPDPFDLFGLHSDLGNFSGLPRFPDLPLFDGDRRGRRILGGKRCYRRAHPGALSRTCRCRGDELLAIRLGAGWPRHALFHQRSTRLDRLALRLRAGGYHRTLQRLGTQSTA